MVRGGEVASVAPDYLPVCLYCLCPFIQHVHLHHMCVYTVYTCVPSVCVPSVGICFSYPTLIQSHAALFFTSAVHSLSFISDLEQMCQRGRKSRESVYRGMNVMERFWLRHRQLVWNGIIWQAYDSKVQYCLTNNEIQLRTVPSRLRLTEVNDKI